MKLRPASVHALSRREWLQRGLASGLAACGPGAQAAPEPPTGWVKPRLPAPALKLIDASGRPQPLSAAVGGKVTAVQLMFTGCSSTCPPQGLLFAEVARRLKTDRIQLLSVSVDALGDTPAALAAWQARFLRHPAWHTAVADAADVDRLGDYMKGVAGSTGTHTSQVFVFDAAGRLAYRTGDTPPLELLVEVLAHVLQNG